MSVWWHIASVPLALFVANGGEWFIHKYILHGLGRKKTSFWSFHWHEHHGEVRRREHLDEAYHRSLLGWHAQSKEALGLFGLGLLHCPLLWWFPAYVVTIWASMVLYYIVHKKSHLNAEWAKKWLPWHYDHHMGPQQDANWCVTFPWFDHLLGTRLPYLGTEREVKDRERREQHRQRRAAQKVAIETGS
jgi:sterol desaturase/sphingolipid hydroxylase (fatty acid hydroxylase superfamily)